MDKQTEKKLRKYLLLLMVVTYVADTAITAYNYNPPYADEGTPQIKLLIESYGMAGFLLLAMVGLCLALVLVYYVYAIYPWASIGIALYFSIVHIYGFITWIIR